MADNENNMSQQQPQLCKQGCGFYGNPNFEGMCSKCHKDYVQRKANAAGVVGRMSPTTNVNVGSERDRAAASLSAFANAVSASAPTGLTVSDMRELMDASVRAEESRVHTASVSVDSEGAVDAGAKADVDVDKGVSSSQTSVAAAAGPAKMSNRCDTCKKKVGLTGFGCRCGGTFCGDHRYSDRHACQFDYKQHGAQQLKKLNPVVVADKVTKI